MRHFVLAAVVAASFVTPADALMLFSFQRISDTEAFLTATGTPDQGFATGVDASGNQLGRYVGLNLEGVFGDFDSGEVEPKMGDFLFGTISSTTDLSFPNEAVTAWGVANGVMRDSDTTSFTRRRQFGDDSAATGVDRLLASGGIAFRPVGTTGQVFTLFSPLTGGVGEQQRVQIGTWEIVAVPLPAAGWLLLGGVGALACAARKRRAA